jgi:hypothetical protein
VSFYRRAWGEFKDGTLAVCDHFAFAESDGTLWCRSCGGYRSRVTDFRRWLEDKIHFHQDALVEIDSVLDDVEAAMVEPA